MWCLWMIAIDITVIFNIELPNFLICIERIPEATIKARGTERLLHVRTMQMA